MYWDQKLERLFIGVHIKSNSIAGTDIAKAVTVGRLDSGVLNLQAIAPDSAITGGATDEIVVVQGEDKSLKPTHLGVMH
ncbi:MAG: hypothetical protein ACD_64C00290G0001, partial [uncultured bacterium]